MQNHATLWCRSPHSTTDQDDKPNTGSAFACCVCAVCRLVPWEHSMRLFWLRPSYFDMCNYQYMRFSTQTEVALHGSTWCDCHNFRRWRCCLSLLFTWTFHEPRWTYHKGIWNSFCPIFKCLVAIDGSPLFMPSRETSLALRTHWTYKLNCTSVYKCCNGNFMMRLKWRSAIKRAQVKTTTQSRNEGFSQADIF